MPRKKGSGRPATERMEGKYTRGLGCWEWTGSKNNHGYGRIADSPAGLPPLYAHRVAWEKWRGPLAAGDCVLHRCDNPPCVNPDHLFLGTMRDNSRDMVVKGRGRGQFVKGHTRNPKTGRSPRATVEITCVACGSKATKRKDHASRPGLKFCSRHCSMAYTRTK